MAGGMCVGFYLDYGPDNYRTGHTTDVGGGRIVSFCQPGNICRDCQPGDILAVRYPDGPRSPAPRESRYVETIAQAREYVTTGAVTAPEATPEQAAQWQAQYADGYRTGRGDARRTARRDGAMVAIPAERPGETGAAYVARNLAGAWRIGYTRAWLYETSHAPS